MPCRWIGVDTFYLRENGEECAVRDILEPYERTGVLNFDLSPGPKYPLQTDWYNECSKLASQLHSWVAFIDIDEFIVVLDKCAPLPPPPRTAASPQRAQLLLLWPGASLIPAPPRGAACATLP